ncbi:GDNF-inducible zinc finger protein 1-like [Homarus americanus]|uniref:Zinc finger protein 39-like n=1 Tax=Homarus americanus TaxID=6706 RepID=A0A8J5N6M4_HOMAM|nr:GDNF-inducible zinc finger protein 1-like [Homarus americanus]KAG7174070.1 Zinc finger protein 39-like [Homarus americanus]
MDKNDMMIVVIGELESDSETILEATETGTIIFKNVSCQTDLEYTSKTSIPLIFCSLLPAIGEASTQADIPVKVSIGISTDCRDTTPSLYTNSEIKVKTEQPENPATITNKDVHLEQTIEDVILGFSANKENQRVDLPGDHMDSDGLADEAALSLYSKDDEKNPEDSEFSSDNDVAFWQKMKLKSKKRRKYKTKSGYSEKKKYLKYPADFSNYGVKIPHEDNHSSVSKMSSFPQQCVEQQPEQTEEGKEAVKEMISIKEEVEVNMDDWITDDEMDAEEEMDIDLAFKLEWKKKRHPYNSKEKNFVCEVCGKLYSKHHYLREHIVRDHSEHEQAKKYPYCCQHCKRLYSGERQLIYHQQQHRGPCEICGVMLRCSGLFWIHRRNHDSQCDVCDKVFQTRSSLDMHMKLKHSEKTVPCPLCPRMFPFKFLMNKHVDKAHNSETPPQHECSECDFSARTEGALNIHQRRIHNKVPKMYKCSKCLAPFWTKISFDKHMDVHNTENGFTCQICMQTFISKNDLYTHKRTAHGGSSSDSIIVEQQALTDQLHSKIMMSNPCEMCNIMFPTRKKLNRHLLKTHAIEIDVPQEPKEVVEESIQLAEMDETAVAVMQIDVNNEDFQSEEPKEEQTIFSFAESISYQGTRSALLMPANVVPPDVNIVDIDGVQYHVIRGNQ